MTTLLAPIAEQNVGPAPGIDEDVEPDAQWKEELRARIEKGLQSMVDKVRQERDAGLRGLREGTREYDAVMKEYRSSMDRVRRLAEDQFSQELKIARFERSLALGKEIEGEEFEAFRRQQQAIWDKIKREGAERPQGRESSTVGGPTLENGDPVAVPPRASGEHDAREGPSMPYRDSRPLARAPAPEYRPRDRTQSGGSDQVAGMAGSYGSRPARSRGNSSVLAADFEVPPMGPSPYDQSSIGRQGLSSLSRTRPQDIWLPAQSKEPSNTTSRTFAHAATGSGISPVSPNVQDGPPGEAGRRTLSRAGSMRSNASPITDLDPGSSLPRDRFGMASVEERIPSRKGKEADRSEVPREPIQPSTVYDYYASRRPDSRMSMPITPARPSMPTQSSDEPPYFYQVNPVPPPRPRAEEDEREREGIPVRSRSSRRSIPSDQGSPENPRYMPSGPASARPIPSKRSYTGEYDPWQTQPSPSPRPMYGPQTQSVPPYTTSNSRPIPRPTSTEDAPRRHSPSGPWHGSQSPPDAFPFSGYDLPFSSSPRHRYANSPAGSVAGARRNSNGGRSVRSRSSRQEFWGPSDVSQRPLATYEEQSVASDTDSEEDYGMDLDDLWHVRERHELTWKLIREQEEAKRQEVLRKAEEAKRLEEEARRKEEEALKKAEEARRKEEEVRQRALEIQQKEEDLRRREAELMKREMEAKLAEERRKREEAEARLAEEIRRRREAEEEAKRREAEETRRREREEAERREREEVERRRREREEADRLRREQEEAERRERERKERAAWERMERERKEKEERDRREREEREKREREERERRDQEERERREREAKEQREQWEREQRAKEDRERRQREAERAKERREWEETRRRQLAVDSQAQEEARREAERLQAVKADAERLQAEAARAAMALMAAEAEARTRQIALAQGAPPAPPVPPAPPAPPTAPAPPAPLIQDEVPRTPDATSRRGIEPSIAENEHGDSDHDVSDELSSPEMIREQQAILEQIQASNRAKEEASRRAEEARRRAAEEDARRRDAEEARKRSEGEARRRAESEAKARAEAEARRLEEEGLRREREARRRAEEEYRRKEEEARKREEAILADVLRRSEEEHRRVEEQRKRQDSVGSASGAYSTASSSAPRPVPAQNSHFYAGASAGDRNSGASSSSYSSSTSFFSAASGRSTSTGYSSSSASRATATPTPSTPAPGPGTSAKGAWKPSGYPQPGTSPSTPSRSNTGSSYHTAFSPSASHTPHASSTTSHRSSAPQSVPSIDPDEWTRRQEEQARRQFEQFQRDQEAHQRRMEARAMKQMSKEDVIKLFEEHERRWARLANMEILTWNSFPWPMLKPPSDPEQITYPEVQAYVLSPHQPGDKTSKERIKDYLRKWHPDRFETKVLPRVREDDREKVKEGAGAVARHLNKLLSSLSGSAENGLFG